MPPSQISQEPIAIVGIGCRFPGAENAQEYWRLLKNGADAVREIPPERKSLEGLYDPDPASPGKANSRWGGFVDNIDGFDWQAFRILPREAQHMDPQHRLLLEVAWEAFEDAGIPLEEIAGSRTGVFIGIMWNDYLRLQTNDLTQLNGYTITGNANSYAPNRISYTYDLRGPSVAFDSGCSSSLATVHAACQSLRTGEADLALAGGVNLLLSPDVPVMLSKAGLLSPDGRCKTLDAKANGFVLGEGAGIAVLKPESKLQPSDRVYALIRGSAINHNGRNEWIMATNLEAQRTVIRDACQRAAVDPAEIDYVELHGSAFPKGDPVEVNAVGEVIGAKAGHQRQFPCAIGSVKSNIGHLESAAGIAGLLKAALSLYHRQIPATLHLTEVNPNIDLDTLGLVAQRTIGKWPDRNRPPLAGVSAISLSGSNAHVVLEGSTTAPESSTSNGTDTYPLLLSTASEKALPALANAYLDFLTGENAGSVSVRDLCFTTCVRRSHLKHRLAILGDSRESFVESLTTYLRGEKASHIVENGAEDIDSAFSDVIERFSAAPGSGEKISASALQHDVSYTTGLSALAHLYVQGRSIDWSSLFPEESRMVPLPTYPWQREKLWLDWMTKQEGHGVPMSREPRNGHGKSEEDSGEVEKRPEILLRLESASANKREQLLLEHINYHVLSVMGLDEKHKIEPHDRLFDAGIDSMTAVELVNRLRASLQYPLSSTTVFNYPTIASLSKYLANQLFQAESHGQKTESLVGGQSMASTAGVDVEELSEEEAEALLMQKLMQNSKGSQQ